MSNITDDEIRIRQKLKDDFEHYASKCLKLRTKAGEIKPFVLNKAQLYAHNKIEEQRALTGKVRVIIVKGRQMGLSSYIEGRFYWRVTHAFGMRAFIMTHEESATNNLFEMAKRYHENCPELVKPSIKTSNAKELLFDRLDSGYKLGTAGNKSTGRSSTIQFLHASEAAFFQHADEHAKGIMQAVPNERGTEIFIESTANGVGNWFHQMWQAAEAGLSDYLPIFIPWHWEDGYEREVPVDFQSTVEEQELQRLYGLTEGQLVWRRYKIIDLSVNGVDGTKSFQQEYPNNANEAFTSTGEDSFIDPNLIMAARKGEAERYGSLVIGVDPARFGDDRTAIIRRHGRQAYGFKTYSKIDTMEIVGIVNKIIEDEKPIKVFVDVGGLGAGVVDRLKELGHDKIVIGVNFGAKPLDAKRYSNKRCEMWGLMKDWLQDEPCQIPDSDELHGDLCNVRYSIDSNSRLVLEKKSDMKKRGIRSSDGGDALALTFALPASALADKSGKDKARADILMARLNKINAAKRIK